MRATTASISAAFGLKRRFPSATDRLQTRHQMQGRIAHRTRRQDRRTWSQRHSCVRRQSWCEAVLRKEARRSTALVGRLCFFYNQSLAGKSSSIIIAVLCWLSQEVADPIALQGSNFVADAAAILLGPPPVSDHAERSTTVIAFVCCRHGTLGSSSVRPRTQNF